MLHNTSYGLELRQSGGLPKHWCHQTHLQLTVSSLNLVAFFKKKNRLIHKKISDVWNVLNNFQCFKLIFQRWIRYEMLQPCCSFCIMLFKCWANLSIRHFCVANYSIIKQNFTTLHTQTTFPRQLPSMSLCSFFSLPAFELSHLFINRLFHI